MSHYRISQANSNELRVLEALSLFGYLTAKYLSYYIWRTSDTSMARRTLNRLLVAQQVASRAREGSNVWAITPRGSKRLREAGMEANATNSSLSKLGNYQHRSLANLAAISHSADSLNQIFPEYQIQKGNHQLNNDFGKMPDYLVDGPDGAIWGEVENSKRSKRDRIHLLNFLSYITRFSTDKKPWLGGGLYLSQVEFICDPAFENWLRKATSDDFCDKWCSFKSRQNYLKFL